VTSHFSRILAWTTTSPIQRGQGLAEYALILALIAIVAIIALIFLGGQVSKILSNVGRSV
jgi:Flp pilus assembly pilin Flp